MTVTLEERHQRQRDERNRLVTVDHDQLAARIGEAEAAEIAAAKADDEAGRQAARKTKARLLLQQSDLHDAIEAKDQAIAETERLIAQRDRDAALERFRAHARRAADLAPVVVDRVNKLVEAIREFGDGLAGAQAAFRGVSRDDEPGLRPQTSRERTVEDALWHVRGALGLDRDWCARGDAIDQANAVLTVAETTR